MPRVKYISLILFSNQFKLFARISSIYYKFMSSQVSPILSVVFDDTISFRRIAHSAGRSHIYKYCLLARQE